jgi:hypothetical protein
LKKNYRLSIQNRVEETGYLHFIFTLDKFTDWRKQCNTQVKVPNRPENKSKKEVSPALSGIHSRLNQLSSSL